MPLFDYVSIVDRASVDGPISAYLNPAGRNLCLDALAVMTDRWRWGTITESEWDELDAAIADTIKALMVNATIGQIIWRAGGIQPNELLCDGTQYNRVDYPDLYDVLDTAYIVNADTFRVPDLAHKSIVGEGSGWVVGDTGGAEDHTLITNEMPAHSHTNTPHSHSEGIAAPVLVTIGLEVPTAAAIPGVSVTGATGVVIDSTGGDQPHNNMPPYEVLTPVMVAY
jgi:microcystin-dependent protein